MARPMMDLFPGGKRKCLTMSYDDGNVADRRLVEVFNKYGVRGTFHLNSGFFGRDNYITAEEVAELFCGHEVSAHSCTHPFLEKIPGSVAAQEVIEDRRALENLVRYLVRGMSYPYGTYNRELLPMLRSIGIEYARTVQSTQSFRIPADFMEWHPTCHHHQCLELVDKFIEHRHGAALFYVWGHSFEFDRANNWDLIEQFCEKIGKREEIWYATNIEIYDYVTALHSLKFSADCSQVYNPTAFEVWFTDQEKNQVVSVAPGEIKNI